MNTTLNFGIALFAMGVLVAGGGFVYFNTVSSNAYSFAQVHGCDLNEGTAHTCIVDGKDYGPQLYRDGVSFMYSYAALLFGGLIGIIGFLLLLDALRKSGSRV